MYKIAISGKAKSGKNTIGSIIKFKLSKQFNYDMSVCQDLAFADPIKNIIQTMFPMAEHRHLHGSSDFRKKNIPLTNITYRQACLDIGKFGRSYDENIWVNLLKDQLSQGIVENKKIQLVYDLRFKNEFNALKDAGFYLIRIKRNDSANINDISETEQDEIPDNLFNKIINNNMSYDELENYIDDVVKDILAYY